MLTIPLKAHKNVTEFKPEKTDYPSFTNTCFMHEKSWLPEFANPILETIYKLCKLKQCLALTELVMTVTLFRLPQDYELHIPKLFLLPGIPSQRDSKHIFY